MLDVKNSYSGFNIKLTPCSVAKLPYVTAPSFRGNDDGIKGDRTSFNYDSDVAKAYASPQLDDTKQKARKIWNEVEKYDNIVILAHGAPDGDAIGSGLALVNLLFDQYPAKKVSFVVPGGRSAMFNDVPGVNLIRESYPTDKKYLAIAVDCSEENMNGLNIYKKADKRINLDHHLTNPNANEKKNSGGLNIVDAETASATAILYNKLFKPLNLKISENTAECLLTGLITDTGKFRNSATNPEAAQTRDELLNILNQKRGFNVRTITEKLDKNNLPSKELNSLYYDAKWNSIISSTKNGKKIEYAIINKQNIKDLKVNDEPFAIYNMTHKLATDLKPADGISVVFSNIEENVVKASLRSNNLNVGEFAQMLGGGGHQGAAGFTLKGNPDEVIDKCLAKLGRYDFKEITKEEI